jgi:hypothetical protein
MSQPTHMTPRMRGAHYQRFRWLLQVSHVGKMMALNLDTQPYFCVEACDPCTQRILQVALSLLVHIVHVQVEEASADCESTRPGSRHTWFKQRLLPEAVDLDKGSHDFLAIHPARHIDPSEETFPEGSNPGVAISDSLCLSRYEFSRT